MKNTVRKQKGITLVALVVTIVVLLILAGVTISMVVGDNGLITKAKEAKNKTEDGRKRESEILNAYEELLYESGIKASDISRMDSKQVKNIYGKYVTNYNPAGNGGIGGTSPFSEHKWQIFGADENHIYLIASDYINNPPNSETQTITTATGNEFEFNMNKVIADYNGSNSITDENIKKLNGNYYALLKAENKDVPHDNMKAVAYMLDTSIWNPLFCDATFASYAIGTPTLELLFKSYNQKYGGNYLLGSVELNNELSAKTIADKGYYISSDGGTTWKPSIAKNENLSLDSTYNIKGGKSLRMALASPCGDGMKLVYKLLDEGSITVNDCTTDDAIASFRPIVCLKSDVKIEKDGENYKLVKKDAD